MGHSWGTRRQEIKQLRLSLFNSRDHNRFFQSRAGAERDDSLCGDRNLFSGLGVPTWSPGFVAQLEASKAQGDVFVSEVNALAGDALNFDACVIVFEAGKVALDIPSPNSGTVLEVLVKVGDKVKAGHPWQNCASVVRVGLPRRGFLTTRNRVDY